MPRRPEPLLSDDVASFLQSGVSIAVATRNGKLAPEGTRAWAARVDEDRIHVTVFLYAKAAGPLLANLKRHPEIAVVFDRPSDTRACQIKGTFKGSRRGRAAERAEVERQTQAFFSDLETLGFPRLLTEGWLFWPCIALTMRVTALYRQTPGPGAGEPMR